MKSFWKTGQLKMKKNKSDKNLFENIKKDSKSFYCKKHFENY